MAPNSPNMDHFTCLCTPNGPASFLVNFASPMFDALSVPKRHIFNAYWVFHGPKRVTVGSKRAKKTSWRLESGPRTISEKNLSFRPQDPTRPTVGLQLRPLDKFAFFVGARSTAYTT